MRHFSFLKAGREAASARELQTPVQLLLLDHNEPRRDEVLTQRVRVPAWEKVWILARSLL